ncbi:MAG: choline dehydrogenase [Rhodospirillales bacterium]|nr:choline dehydrogenase [Rhodospirillales bacterium]MBO6786146.1 choline dehydrogenase [Rhodospirillales bacterium]
MHEGETTYDYIIVGAGSAGCVLANRLSADRDLRILLLEAGGRDSNPWIHVPVGYFKTLHNPKTDWCYKTDPEPGLGGRSLDWPRGKVLGGSSSINGLLYIRGQAEDYDHWRQLGNAGWSHADVLPYFKRAENQERGGNDFHGADGPLHVSDMRAKRDVCEALIAAAEANGIPRSTDFNGAKQEGAGYFQLTAHNGKRCSSAVAYLRPIEHRDNLDIVVNAPAVEILFDADEPGKVTGFAYRKDGTRHEAKLKPGGEVILSAGAIGSPQILQVSGIGPGALLSDAGVKVRCDRRDVGENLQDHLQIRMIYEVNVPTLNDEINNPIRRTMMGLEYILKRTGPMSMGASQVCIFTKTQPELETPDIQFHFQPLSADKPGIKMHPFSGVTSSICQLRPESRGRIAIKSPDPDAYPSIQPNYLSAEKDRRVVVDSIKTSRRIFNTSPLKDFVVRERLPGPDIESDDDILESARKIAQTIYHPTSTCRMGADEHAVVDSKLRVNGIKGLRVVDASVMPTIVSGNTNAPTIMIAEKASDMILDDRRG